MIGNIFWGKLHVIRSLATQLIWYRYTHLPHAIMYLLFLRAPFTKLSWSNLLKFTENWWNFWHIEIIYIFSANCMSFVNWQPNWFQTDILLFIMQLCIFYSLGAPLYKIVLVKFFNVYWKFMEFLTYWLWPNMPDYNCCDRVTPSWPTSTFSDASGQQYIFWLWPFYPLFLHINDIWNINCLVTNGSINVQACKNSGLVCKQVFILWAGETIQKYWVFTAKKHISLSCWGRTMKLRQCRARESSLPHGWPGLDVL